MEERELEEMVYVAVAAELRRHGLPATLARYEIRHDPETGAQSAFMAGEEVATVRWDAAGGYYWIGGAGEYDLRDAAAFLAEGVVDEFADELRATADRLKEYDWLDR
jgi:hypothetical protein